MGLYRTSPLSTNANSGNIDEPPKLKATSIKSASSAMLLSDLTNDSPESSPRRIPRRRTPLRPRTSQHIPTAQLTPLSQRSRSSLPGWHYSAALPSPIAFNIGDCEEDNDKSEEEKSFSDASIPSSGASLKAGWTRLSALRRGRRSGEGQCDKENGGSAQYSPPCLENVKSKIAKNKLRRDAIAKSESLMSILSTSSRDRADASNAATKGSNSKASHPEESSSTRAIKRSVEVSSHWSASSGKRHKVNLAPKIAGRGCAVNRRRQKIDHATNVAMESVAPTPTAAIKMQSSKASMKHQMRTQKCLREALIMQSKSYESDCSDKGEGPINDATNDCCSKKGSDYRSMRSGSNAPSLEDPFFARLNAKLDSFKNGRRLAGRETSASDTLSSIASSRSGNLSNSQSQSDAGSSRVSSVAASWLVGGMTESGVAMSTFSVSPITKESSSTIVGSYIGSVQLDSKMKEINKKLTRASCMSMQARPKEEESQAKETISGCSQFYPGAKNEPGSVKSYIGSFNVERPNDKPQDDKEAKPQFTNTINMVPIDRGKELSETSSIERCKSFPPPSIDVTPDNKPKGKMSPVDDETSSLLPSQGQNTITRMGYTCSTSSSVFRNRSPVPTVAYSHAPSYATSMATETTTSSETPNLFDKLRNTVNHSDGEDRSSDVDSENQTVRPAITPRRQLLNVLPPSILPASNRPPRSPKPPTRSGKRQGHRGCSRAQKGTVLTPKPDFPGREQKSTPKMTLSPVIVRGTPCKTPRSYASSDLPDSQSSVFCKDSPDAGAENQMEFSFLANALVATNILTTPPANIDKEDADTHNDKAIALAGIQIKNSEDLMANQQTESPFSAREDKSANKTHQELNYASIGATCSLRPRSANPAGPVAQNVNPMAIESEATSKSLPIEHSFNGGLSNSPGYMQRLAGENSEKIAQASEDCGRSSLASMPDILSIASALDNSSSFESSESGSVKSKKSESSKERQISESAEKVGPKAYLDGGLGVGAKISESMLLPPAITTAATSESEGNIDPKDSNNEEIAKLCGRINRLESELKGKVMTLEQRLEKEMALKEEASRQVLKLTADLESFQDAQKSVDVCLKEKVGYLEEELESERRMHKEEHERMESSRAFMEESLQEERRSPKEKIVDKASEVTNQEATEMGRELNMKDEEIKQMQRANKDLEQQLEVIGKELASCAEDNNTFRTRILSLAAESSTRDHTLSEALSQLKSLSESHYHVQTSLGQEREGRRQEVLSLQSALDDISCEMINLSRKSNQLQAENGFLKEQLRNQRLEKARSMVFCRAARGG